MRAKQGVAWSALVALVMACNPTESGSAPSDAKPDPQVFPRAVDPPEVAPPIPPREKSPPVPVPAKPAGGRAIHLNEKDSGKKVSAGLGDLVIIELEANPTTGFGWEADPAVKDSVLVLKSKAFETLAQRNPEVRPAIGQGGFATITYQVAKTGKGAVSLVYRRPWEKDARPAKTFRVEIEATRKSSPVVTGAIVFSEEPEVEKISRIVVSIRNTALADGPAPLVGEVELKPPFKMPVTFAVPYDPSAVQPNPMFYSISVRVSTVVDGSEKLYYINDTRHNVLRDANDTKCDVTVKKVR